MPYNSYSYCGGARTTNVCLEIRVNAMGVS